MPTPDMKDWELLQGYVVDHSEDAFGLLVKRHLDLVYSAALRQVRWSSSGRGSLPGCVCHSYAASDFIVVQIKGAGQHFAVARMSLLSDGDNFIREVNKHRERLLDAATATFVSKTIDDIETIAFRNGFKMELRTKFNQVLGANVVKEVIIMDFVVQ